MCTILHCTKLSASINAHFSYETNSTHRIPVNPDQRGRPRCSPLESVYRAKRRNEITVSLIEAAFIRGRLIQRRRWCCE